jgi:hypothetical protein
LFSSSKKSLLDLDVMRFLVETHADDETVVPLLTDFDECSFARMNGKSTLAWSCRRPPLPSSTVLPLIMDEQV